MDSRIIKKDNRKFVSHFPVTLPSMGWYFSSVTPKDSIELQPDIWTCMFKHIAEVAKGNKICFSKNSAGCSGAACYFGFTQPNEKAGAQDYEVMFSCPGEKLDILMEGIEKTHTAGLRYPIPQYMNYSPGFQASFEKAALDRAGGTIEKK